MSFILAKPQADVPAEDVELVAVGDERAVQLDPTDAMAHNNLAVAYEGTGDFEKARANYIEALRLSRHAGVGNDPLSQGDWPPDGFAPSRSPGRAALHRAG